MRMISSKKTTGKLFSFILFGAFMALLFLPKIHSVQAACTYPAQVLDITNCKETLPTGKSGSPTEITQPALATYAADPYFHANQTCDGVVFRAPVNGVTTSNSGYPRSELREMTDNGTSNASWSTTSGTHTMFIDEAITSVPKTKRHIVAGQVHDANDDVIVIRLEYPKLFVDINGKTGPTLDANYTLGKRFTVKFVASSGKIDIYYNGSQTASYTLSKSDSGCYFKAGAYTQSNCSKESDCSSNNFGEVVIYNLSLNGKVVIPPADTTTPPNTTVTTTDTADTTAPTISLSAPTSDATISGTASISATASDNVGVVGVQFKVDGNNVGSEDTSSPYSISWNTTTVSNGTHDITAIARDAGGNTATAAIITATVSNNVQAPPVAPPITPPTPSSASDVSFEAESGTVTAPMQIVSDGAASGGKYIVQTTDKGTGDAKYTVNIPSAGKYQLRTKVISPNGSSNSFYYSLDGGSSKNWSLPNTIKNWTWVDGPSINLTQGAHTLEIKKREKNTRLDAFDFRLVTEIIGTATADATTAFEAESGVASGGMHILDDTTASGNKYVKADSSGSVDYQLSIATAGTYRLAGWIEAFNGSSDSFSFSVDGKSANTWTLGYPATTWNYDVDDNHTFSLSAGLHTLTIKYREAGAKIDRVVLVKQ